MNEKKTMQIKPYEKLEFRDDFMFGKTMEDKGLCKDLLECLLQRPVGELKEVATQREIRYSTEGKPIRLDICSSDEDTVYDAEMQNLGNKAVKSLELPKRSRFYQSSIDTDHMNKGFPYKSLPDSVILFICTFDPFGKGLGIYTFHEKCKEDDSVILNDGTERIFYNCSYGGKEIPEEIRNLFDYIDKGKVSSELTKRIDYAVCEARKREEWRSAYMKEMTVIMDAKEEGFAEGKAVGIAEEQLNTERERQRADKAEAELSEYRKQFGLLS